MSSAILSSSYISKSKADRSHWGKYRSFPTSSPLSSDLGMARMAQRHAVIFVKPGPSFDERFDMVDFIRRGQPPFLLAHNTEGIVSQIPRSELRPGGVVPAFTR